MAKFKDTFELVDKVSKPLLKMSRKFAELDKSIGKSQKRLERFKKQTENIANLGNKIKDVGKGMTLGVTLPVIAVGGAMVKAAADVESMQQQLETMTGSAEAGGKMFNEIKTMAAKTPFETKDLMKATNTMLGFGIAQEKVLPLMNQLGDISGGNADRFQSLALAFSQVSSAGKLQGQDLNQMINAGFNPLENIAKRTGKSVGYWKEQMSKGKVTVDMVEQAMKDATSEGGRFFGMMDKQSKTALGQWSTFQDNLNMLLAEFGKIILPTAIKALQKLSSMLEWFNSLSPAVKKTIVVFAGILAIVGPLITIIGALTTAFAGLNVALGFLAAHPVVATIIAIVAAITALVLITKALWKNWEKIPNWLKGLMGLLMPIIGVIELIIAGIKKIQEWRNKGNQEVIDNTTKKVSNNKKGSKGDNNSINNSNNTTTTNITNNNYSAGANPRNAQYTK